ncbi:DUF5955 family protein [Streptomyces sp. WMMC1477]|uniref:DUF5955 family protein n=1 Tax=Streptomyces sp. WMMC1477 TaxID=3015155 RepID=UPI0022B69017|nr:DUF5955 family protein [Streptomyces sp. WMMC1477]MCZ7434308.1 DUF5955 family protein [Streptomyces sp. WMMC1477]
MEPAAVRQREQHPVETVAAAADPRAAALRSAVVRARRALAAHSGRLADREVADEQLARLEAMAAEGAVDVPALRQGLLQVVGVLGSLSALADAVRELREAVLLFGEPVRRR